MNNPKKASLLLSFHAVALLESVGGFCTFQTDVKDDESEILECLKRILEAQLCFSAGLGLTQHLLAPEGCLSKHCWK